MEKNKIAILIVGAVVIAGTSFFAGTKYSQTTNPTGATFGQNGSRQQFGQIADAGGARNLRGGNVGFVNGEIISQDDKSITVKITNARSSDGTTSNQIGSKIVLLSASTTIMKTADGSIKDLVKGENVVVSGTPNSDSSITATSIQIRPTMPPAPTTGQIR